MKCKPLRYNTLGGHFSTHRQHEGELEELMKQLPAFCQHPFKVVHAAFQLR